MHCNYRVNLLKDEAQIYDNDSVESKTIEASAVSNTTS